MTTTITPPLKWHGGKSPLARRIVVLAPPHLHYVEPFAGVKEADVVRGFITSSENLFKHRGDPALANVLHTQLLVGAATASELQDWNGRLSSLDAQRAALANQNFATPDDYKAKLAATLGGLDNEPAKTGVLFDVLNSDEFKQRATGTFFIAFLHRRGTAAEEQQLLQTRDDSGNAAAPKGLLSLAQDAVLQTRGPSGNLLDMGSIAELILASPEYRANAARSEV